MEYTLINQIVMLPVLTIMVLTLITVLIACGYCIIYDEDKTWPIIWLVVWLSVMPMVIVMILQTLNLI